MQRDPENSVSSGEDADHIRVTNSLPLMAYFMMSGVELVKACREGENNRFCFYYLDPTGMTRQLETKWVNSPFHHFDGIVKSLRDMLVDQRPPRRRRRRSRHPRRPDN